MKLSRRAFLKATAPASAALGAPRIVPSGVLGANAPSDRIHVGCIGTGNHGVRLVQGFLQNDDVRVVAVCDVNAGSRGYKIPSQYLGREPARGIVRDYYGRRSRSGRFRGCQATSDFREVLARGDIDAVTIATPDHWHAVMTITAAEAGKHIYCEKPLSLTVADGRAMARAVRRCGVVLQTGSQERSSSQARFACELVRSGRIGRLQRIRTYVGPNSRQCPPGEWLPMPVPKGLDYDLWLGPAPWQPYHRDRCLYSYRYILDYSGGQVTNYGAHCIDLAQWGNDTEHTAPVEVEDLGSEFPRDGLFNTATQTHFRARYANGVELICRTREDNMAVRFEGTDGWVETGYAGFLTQPESLRSTVIGPNEVRLHPSTDHYRNFLDCIRTGREPAAPVEVGHYSATVCHLGRIAMQLGRKLRWDPAAERFCHDDEANRMLRRPLRPPWRL